jgi:hypothetical protein
MVRNNADFSPGTLYNQRQDFIDFNLLSHMPLSKLTGFNSPIIGNYLSSKRIYAITGTHYVLYRFNYDASLSQYALSGGNYDSSVANNAI